MYVRDGLGKWYEGLLNVVGEAGAAVAEAYGGQGAGAAVRGLHKGWTQAAFNRGKGGAPAQKGGPPPQQPGPQYAPPPYYPPPLPPAPATPAGMFGGRVGGISTTTLAIGALVVVGGGLLLMRSKKG